MSDKKVNKNANRVGKREKTIKNIVSIILIIFFLLFFMYLFLSLLNNGGRFFISLNSQDSLESGLIMYDNSETRDPRIRLYTEEIDFMDNISINWLPKDIGENDEGSHNGDSYIAHTFYVANDGRKELSYWYEIHIENVIRNVDEAIRFMVIFNGEKTVYAKKSSVTGNPEPNTVEFNSDDIAVLEERKNIKPEESDKITIVIWLEGDDPDCIDDIIGGEIKGHMRITEVHENEQEG